MSNRDIRRRRRALRGQAHDGATARRRDGATRRRARGGATRERAQARRVRRWAAGAASARVNKGAARDAPAARLGPWAGAVASEEVERGQVADGGEARLHGGHVVEAEDVGHERAGDERAAERSERREAHVGRGEGGGDLVLGEAGLGEDAQAQDRLRGADEADANVRERHLLISAASHGARRSVRREHEKGA
jgi:hypothetical protein